jgi:hypothetical protein
MTKNISESEAWDIIKPVCRELYELVNEKMVSLISATETNDGSFIINLKSRRIHLASRGFKDSIGDFEYANGKIRVGLRANGRPGNVYIELDKDS